MAAAFKPTEPVARLVSDRSAGDRAAVPLVHSRLVPPRPPEVRVAQARHRRWLTVLENRDLGLVHAPAGYGKSTLCAEWYDALARRGHPVGWFGCDGEQDGDAAPIAYVIAAMRAMAPAARIGDGADPRLAATHVLNAAAMLTMPGFLFLDDVDRVRDPATIAFLAAIVRHCPPTLHLVMSCRARPALDLDRLDRQGRMLRIGARDLALRDGEASELLQATPVASAVLRARNAALGGWVAGLKGAGNDIALDALPVAADRAMLARCAVLGTGNAAAFVAVSGRPDAGAVLAELAEGAAFVERDAGGADLYRILPPLRAALLAALGDDDPAAAAALHRTAGTLLATQGQTARAIGHLLDGGASDAALALLRSAAMALIAGGEIAALGDLLARLPADRDDVSLAEARAWVAALAMRPAADDADPAIAAMRAIVRDDRPDLARPPGEAALAADAHGFAAEMAHVALGMAALAGGDHAGAHRHALSLRPIAGTAPSLAFALRQTLIGSTYRAQGRPGEAERTYRAAFLAVARAPEARCTASAELAAHLAHARYERGDVDGAADLLDDRWPVLERTATQDAMILAQTVLARIAAGRADIGGAAARIERIEALAFDRGWRRLQAASIVERSRLGLPYTIAPDALLAAADEEAAIADPAGIAARVFAILAEVRIYEAMDAGDRPRLNLVSDRLMRLAIATGHAEWRLRAALFSILPQLSGRCDRMVDPAMVKLLNQGAQNGFQRTMTDVLEVNGVRIGTDLGSASYAPSSFLALLALVDPPRGDGCPASHGEALSFLTTREIEILTALAAGDSNKEMARQLKLTPETVKWHLKNVMRKLGAETRIEAIANASTFGLTLRQD